MNLYIFSETNKFSGNIEVSQVFTASVLHNYFKIKSEEVIDKRRIPSITPRILLDICENFLSLCVYQSLQLNRSDFYESLNTYTPIFVPYLEELLRIYESELIFHFDEDGILAIRHMKFFEYLYADYMNISTKFISLRENIQIQRIRKSRNVITGQSVTYFIAVSILIFF